MDKNPEKILASIPPGTGVYLMKDKNGAVIYIGKAVNLRARVRSYFRETGDNRPAIRFLRNRIEDVEFILTDSAKEAVILENNLIKQHRPRYNIQLRDDKDYLCLRLTTREKFPRLIKLRRPRPTGEPTFGPYSSASELKETLSLLNKAFPLRTCSPRSFRHRKRPCLNHQIGRCPAPCAGRIGPEEYNELVRQVKMILSGKGKPLVDEIRRRMKDASDNLNFEAAAVYRDRLKAVEDTLERQKMVRAGGPDRDIIGIHTEGERVAAVRMGMRGGKVISSDSYFFHAPGRNDGEVLEEFILRLYDEESEFPREILIPVAFEELGASEEWLSERAGRKVRIRTPRIGEGRAMIELAVKNAAEASRSRTAREFDAEKTLSQLAQRLGLPGSPERIEGVDISNISGKQAVGSVVAFTGASPDKSRYHRYKIRGPEEPDDYAMIKQVLERRISRGIKEGDLPDLILVDGGKGQLNAVLRALSELEAPHIPVASMAKDRKGFGGDRVYVPGRKNPVMLPASALNLLRRVRDEAHRFAVSYHRNLRRKSAMAGELTRIQGIGPAKRDALLRHFGSLKKIKEAAPDELRDVPKITRKDAEAVYNFFHGAERRTAEKASG